MGYGLSLRLQTCLEALLPFQKIADIGTDHAYLPCVGILNGQIKQAIAADIGKGPLEAAQQTIEKYGLQNEIETRLGSGLSVLNLSEVDAVVIAGMGGKLITTILENDITLAKSFKRLVLQPNIDANVLRKFLSMNQFEIIDEKIILEDEKFYEVIVAKPCEEPINYQLLDIEFGPVLRLNKEDKVFQQKWRREYQKNEAIIAQLPVDHVRRKALVERQALLKEVL